MTIVQYKSISLIPWSKKRMFLIELSRSARNILPKIPHCSGAIDVIQIDACLPSYNPRAKAIIAAPIEGILQNIMVS